MLLWRRILQATVWASLYDEGKLKGSTRSINGRNRVGSRFKACNMRGLLQTGLAWRYAGAICCAEARCMCARLGARMRSRRPPTSVVGMQMSSIISLDLRGGWGKGVSSR